MCVTKWKRSVGKGLILYDPSSRTLGKGQTVETVKGEMEARGAEGRANRWRYFRAVTPLCDSAVCSVHVCHWTAVPARECTNPRTSSYIKYRLQSIRMCTIFFKNSALETAWWKAARAWLGILPVSNSRSVGPSSLEGGALTPHWQGW